MAGITIKFLGAAGTVTGSKYLVSFADQQILVDSGMFQGDKEWRLRNWDPFPVDPATLTGVLLTHAHMDHCGYLPALVKQGFTAPIWCTSGTRALAEIVLRDAGFLQEREAQEAQEGGYSKHNPPHPLYDSEDVEATLPLFRTIDFDTDLDLGGAVARYTRSGHILGSASIRIATPDSSVLFSGDVGRTTHPVLRSREIPQGADTVLIESTYGDRDHPEPEVPHADFADAVRRTIARGGVVLIPAFAVDRTEIVLQTLTEMIDDGRIHDVPIFVNSPMALAALAVYRDKSQRGELRPDIDVETFVNLRQLREVKTTEESIALNRPPSPCIIISSSGMATGGRVLHHLEHLLPDPRNCVILTGYQASGTRGRALQEGAKQLKLRGRYVPVKAEIVSDHEFSVHGDRSDLLSWLQNLSPKPKNIYCVHGEADAAQAFATEIHEVLDVPTVVPKYAEVIRGMGGQVEVLAEGIETPPLPAPPPSLPTATPPSKPVQMRRSRHPLSAKTRPARKQRRSERVAAPATTRVSAQRTAADDFFARFGQLLVAGKASELAELYAYPYLVISPEGTRVVPDLETGITEAKRQMEILANNGISCCLPEIQIGEVPGNAWVRVEWREQDFHGHDVLAQHANYQLVDQGEGLKIVSVTTEQ